jgi:dihydroorotate dehydrogenase electron transfer subunit
VVEVSWQIEDGIVIENSLVGSDMGRMLVEAPEVTRAAQPGQFLMIRCWEGEPLLPRAMAPLTYDVEAGRMEIFYRIMGPGTEAMAEVPAGAIAHVTGPLGQPVTQRFDGQTIALVGRGVGITPLLPLARHIVATGGAVSSYLSARTSVYLFGLDQFRVLGPVQGRADDEGFVEQRVTSILEEACETQRVDAAYVCGSRRLIRHTADIGDRHNFPAYVFLEEKMGCGVGYCKGCPIELLNGAGYKLVCTDGPLFLAREVVLA